MSSSFDHEITITGWQGAWLGRELPALWSYTQGLTYALSSALIFIGVRTLVNQRRTYKALDADPSSRAAILAAHEKQMQGSSRSIFGISLGFFLNAAVIYFVDAFISIDALQRDASSIPWSTEPSFLLAFGTMIGTIIVTLGAAFVLVPLAQIAVVSWCISRRFPGGESLADYVPEARIVATYMALMWVMVDFFIVAWWPVETHSTTRILAYMASCGSAVVWMDASFAFNYCADRLEEVKLKGLSGVGGVGRIIRKFGQHVVAVHGFSKGNVEKLPKYETRVQSENISEKSALL